MHGAETDRRYRRLFPRAPRRDPGKDAIEALAVSMLTASEPLGRENIQIEAGYTYLGQFIDHDLTFSATPDLGPRGVRNLRTPRLDLDSLYGAGPIDQPYLYDWPEDGLQGVKLLVDGHDVPRNRQGRALMGDPRNDDHQIIAQLHQLFCRFHNAVVDQLAAGEAPTGGDLFEAARQIVRWHYQWIVAHEFISKIAGARFAAAVLREPRLNMWLGGPIPLEFAGAVYRFGHSMVRLDYRLNGNNPAADVFGAKSSDLRGFRRIPKRNAIQWERFYVTAKTDTFKHPIQLSMKINPQLSNGLARVPPAMFALARRNLERGRMLRLPDGRSVAEACGEKALSERELLRPLRAHPLPDAARRAIVRSPPLWYYVLAEADIRRMGSRLGPTGGRIVVEVLRAVLEGDPTSYRSQQPAWKPRLGKRPGVFTMRDLIEFTEDGVP